jgi:CSLREA domain-containing protein
MMNASKTNTAARRHRGAAAIAIAILALLGLASPAGAATINVTTTTDEFAGGSRCSLREAIWSSNNDSTAMARGCVTGSGSDVVVVPAGRFRLTRFAQAPDVTAEDAGVYGDLDVTAPVSIVHRGVRPATVDSNVSGERVFHTLAAGISLNGLQIVGGDAGTDPDNHGGGILNQGTLTVSGSTISSNSATFGGGLSTEGPSTATLVNTTVSGNSAGEDGGGISVEVDGQVILRSVTVANNRADSDRSGGGDGGGLFASTTAGGGVLTLRNTLVASNSDSGNEAPDCARLGGAITSQGRNLVGNTNGCDYLAGPGDVVNRGARLLSLDDNGGPSLTHALKRGSPALNAGAKCNKGDQRGVARALGGKCDIGAWELVRCEGVVVNRVGTGGPDLLTGSSGADGFLLLGGNDTARGANGNDGLCGGAGKDRLEGGAGNDHLAGGAGRDTCLGGGGRNARVGCELPKQVKKKAQKKRPKGKKVAK